VLENDKESIHQFFGMVLIFISTVLATTNPTRSAITQVIRYSMIYEITLLCYDRIHFFSNYSLKIMNATS
jgi:hypothetical protein